ncbi:MAG: PfkB family carbohydrate kinase [Nitrospiraceae bacterium]|nr:PfkB family carbohydrate kinase [Nitrospiraceae bacterium]
MSILVVGSVALDTVKTPFGRVEEALGGSATYFSTSASYFTDVQVVAVVGQDFPERHVNFLKTRRVDLKGLERVPGGRTFRWEGFYDYDLNKAHTLKTELGVFETFHPEIPQEYRDAQVVFLANIDPVLQKNILAQVKAPRLVAADTMNFWIASKRAELLETLKLVDILTINDAETRELAGEPNLVKAARKIIGMGPKTLIIKRGEYGVLMFNGGSTFSAPAYPLESVFDPTGAGDTFAGGFMGYIASIMDWKDGNLRKALVMGSVMASFAVEDFSLGGISSLDYPEIEKRFREFKRLSHFEDI